MRNEVLNIFRKMYLDNGADLFLNNSKLVSYLKDMLVEFPKERARLCFVARENIVSKIYREVSSEDLSRCGIMISLLVDTYSMSDIIATDIVNAICYALFGRNYSGDKHENKTVTCEAGTDFLLQTKLIKYTGADVEEIIVPDGVEVIGQDAFLAIENVKRIVLPNTVKVIEANAFYWLMNLEEINLPDSVISIGAWAFCGCESLKELTLPDKIETIEEFAFSRSGIERIELPKGLKKIKHGSFMNCKRLKEIYIPEKVELIEDMVFTASGIEKFDISPDNPKFEFWNNGGILVENMGVKEKMTYGIDDRIIKTKVIERKLIWFRDAFLYNNITVPSEIAVIANRAFPHSAKGKRIIIPNSVTKIEDEALPPHSILICERGSAAEGYAIKNNLKYIYRNNI